MRSRVPLFSYIRRRRTPLGARPAARLAAASHAAGRHDGASSSLTTHLPLLNPLLSLSRLPAKQLPPRRCCFTVADSGAASPSLDEASASSFDGEAVACLLPRGSTPHGEAAATLLPRRSRRQRRCPSRPLTELECNKVVEVRGSRINSHVKSSRGQQAVARPLTAPTPREVERRLTID